MNTVDFRPDARVFVAGHRGLVGSALVRALRARGFTRLQLIERGALDLTQRDLVLRWFEAERPEFVFLAAGKVGGIVANRDEPVEFLHDNLLIQEAVMSAAYSTGTRKLLFLGSSCIYPKNAAQPIVEEALLSGPLEPTNKAYALAKIAGIAACEGYRSEYGARFIAAMPTNLYGPGDNFEERSSHVLPAMIRKLYLAERAGAAEVRFWGSGRPRREFLFVDDLAQACLHLMDHFEPAAGELSYVNVGYGEDMTIAELATLVARVVGYHGKICWDESMPDGTPRKLLSVQRIHDLGWRASVPLATGIETTFRWFLEHAAAEL